MADRSRFLRLRTTSLLSTQAEPGREQNGQRSFSVLNRSRANQLESMGERHRFDRQEFVSLAQRLAMFDTGSHECVNALVGEAWCCVEAVQVLYAGCPATGFLEQLAPRAIDGTLAWIQAPRRHLVEVPLRGITVLLDEEDLWIVAARIGEKREHRTRARMSNHLQLANRVIRKANFVDVEVQETTRIDAMTRQLRGRCRAISGGSVVLRHRTEKVGRIRKPPAAP